MIGYTRVHVSQVQVESRAPGSSQAICVLLGWKSGVAPDVSTWVPEHIPYKEAMAQKEDVILW